MSSKSKKKTLPPSVKPHGHALAKGDEPETEHDAETHDLTEKVEEVLHVPTGRNPLRFLITVLVVILLIAIFAIDPGTIFQATQRGGDVFMTWNHPSKGKLEYSGAEFQNALRSLNDFLSLYQRRPTHEDAASFLVLADLAQEAGIHITDAELTKQLSMLATAFGDAAALTQYMRQTAGGIRGFEETVRKQMAGQRYVRLLAYVAATPDPVAIEKVWLTAHQERAFDYVELDKTLLLEDARAELPDDAALEQWLAERDELEKSAFEEPERLRAELVGFLFDAENDAAGLLARYPETPADEHADDEHDHEGDEHEDEAQEGDEHEDEATEEDGVEPAADPDQAKVLAKNYYDRVLYWRFARPLAEGEIPPSDFTARYFPLEEVEAIAEKEAPIYFALERWLADLRKRTLDGETIDLAAEAQSLGLSYRPGVDSLSGTEWNDVAGFGGASLGARLSRLAPNEITPVLMIDKGGITIGRLAEKTPAFMPEFALVRDAVATAWTEARAGELAVARLAALRDGFEPLPKESLDTGADTEEATDAADATDTAQAADAEPTTDAANPEEVAEGESLPYATETAFAEAAAALGLEVKRRPHLEDAAVMSRDPNAALPGHAFIRGNAAEYAALKEGEIAAPALSFEGTHAFLVRAAGSRDPEAWTITPLEYEQSLQAWEYQTSIDFVRDNFSFDVLAEDYAITLPKSDG